MFALQVTPLPDRAEGVVLTLRDVTDERRLERARRDLVANVSHELKTPLTALTGFIELLEDPRLDAGRRREFVELMAGEAARLDRLVEEQLELARLDSGRLRLDREPLDLGRPGRERHGVPPRARPARGGHPLGRPGRPRRRWWSRPTARGSSRSCSSCSTTRCATRRPAARCGSSVAREDGSATLAVADTGEGIPAEAQPFVFDRFYQADPSREGRGTGLGLAIARGLAQAHGGAIELRSTPGVGSTFTLRLPLAAVSAPRTRPPRRPPPPEPRAAPLSSRVVVADPTVLVTGAGRGIGRASVLAFLDAGWRAVAGVRDQAAARAAYPVHERLLIVAARRDRPPAGRGTAWRGPRTSPGAPWRAWSTTPATP